MSPVYFCTCSNCNCTATVLNGNLPHQEDAFLDYSTSFPLVASSPPVTEGTEVETGEESGRRPSSDPPLHHQLNILEILVVILIGASAAIGVAQCLMCLWNHFGQKKTLDCSVRRNVGNFRLGCSIHVSYKNSSSPYSTGRPRGRTGGGRRGESSGYSGHFNKHLPRMDKSKLSASLSSLRCLTSESSSTGPHHFSRSERSVRSSHFLHKTQSTSSSSWL